MPIRSLSITEVGPFDEIEFEFDPQVNVFTGPNNSGKSSALCVLGDVTVFPFQFPRKLLRSDNNAKFEVRIQTDSDINFPGELPCRLVRNDGSDPPEGYWTKERFAEHIAVMKKIGYSKFIPALRRGTDFRSPGPTPGPINQQADEMAIAWRSYPFDSDPIGKQRTARQIFARNHLREASELDPELKRRLALTSDDPSLVSDEAVIQKIIELDYRSYLRKKSAFHDVITKIGDIASDITDGFPIKFIGVNEDTNGFFPEFETIDGVVPLNTMSQGTQSIIQWLGHLLIGYAEYYDFPTTWKRIRVY